ncbi:unnamed protein product [Coregonus sp. 'balchen']|nr:unnamed protein product [Coregonus sp. 'balchen']
MAEQRDKEKAESVSKWFMTQHSIIAGQPEWSKQVVEDILSQLSLPEVEAQESEVSTAGAKEDLGVELERSVDNPNNLPPRERKAGCKNFYWKGFTSC